MIRNQKNDSLDGTVALLYVLVNVIVLRTAFIKDENWYYVLFLTIPLLILPLLRLAFKQASTTEKKRLS